MFFFPLTLLGCQPGPKGDDSAPADADGDGFALDDCDDGDPEVHPGATEYCDGLDNDCDRRLDRDAADAAVWYADADADGYGSASAWSLACSQPGDHVADATDCDDRNAVINMASIEACNGVDDDCDGSADEAGAVGERLWYADVDGDGYGDSDSSAIACDQPIGFVSEGADCADAASGVNPAATEVCDPADVDEDCSGAADSADVGVDPSSYPTWYADPDGDGVGDSAEATIVCDAPAGYVPIGGDNCPAEPNADQADVDADGVGDACPPASPCDDWIETNTLVRWTVAASDGGADALSTLSADGTTGAIALRAETASASTFTLRYDLPPSAAVDVSGHEAARLDLRGLNTSAWEGSVPTLTIEDAGGVRQTYTPDNSQLSTDGGTWGTLVVPLQGGSGWTADGGADLTQLVAIELSVDSSDAGFTLDVDGLSFGSRWYADDDGDTFGDTEVAEVSCVEIAGTVTDASDCDDADALVNPASAEVCDEVDNDCDGAVDTGAVDATTWYADVDADTYGDPSASTVTCDSPGNYVSDDSDCDDDNAGQPDALGACAVPYTTAFGSAMLVVEPGTFTMGGGAGDPADFYLDHEVTLTHTFWLGQSELTQDQWSAWTAATEPTPSFYTGGELPVETVSWEMVAVYLNALSVEDGVTECFEADGSDLLAAYVSDPYACPGYRFPTEAEWEYAARAGEDTEFSGSNAASDVAWYDSNSAEATHEVCQLASNAWGFCDMSGNVREWTHDWYSESYGGYLDGVAETDPIGPSSSIRRTNRGGTWVFVESSSRVASRFFDYPDIRYGSLGVRVARTSLP